MLRRARLCVFDPGERLQAAGARATRVYVLLRGSVRLLAPAGGRPAAAGPGALVRFQVEV